MLATDVLNLAHIMKSYACIILDITMLLEFHFNICVVKDEVGGELCPAHGPSSPSSQGRG